MIVLPTGETLINFRKFQQIGEHLSEIQQYQNMPYDIPGNVDIQRELRRLNPMKGFADENSFQNYLVTLKEHIEPADASPRVFVSHVESETSMHRISSAACSSARTIMASAFARLSSIYDPVHVIQCSFAYIKSMR